MFINAYGAHAGDKPLESMQIARRAPGAHDVQIDIHYCGVCHSDIHLVRAEWAGALFPCVPGHEIVGRVSAIGTHVQGFKAGDLSLLAAWSIAARIARSAMQGWRITAMA